LRNIIDRLGVPSLGRSNFALGRVQCPTQGNAADAHSAGTVPSHTRRSRGRTEGPYQKKNKSLSLYDLSTGSHLFVVWLIQD